MTLRPELERLLARLSPSDRVDMDQLAAALYEVRYTGITITHWHNGRAKQIDLGAPVRLSIVDGLDRRNGSPP